MKLYLQKNYGGDFTLAELNTHKDEVFDCDYFGLEDLDGTMTYKDLATYVKEKYGCEKLVLQF